PFGPARPEIWSESTFAVLPRAIAEAPALPVPKGVEAVMPEFPQGRFTTLLAGERGLTVANHGLPEAAVIPVAEGWALAMTLIRAVGWLSRDDLSTRGGGAGPRFETPEAQCLGVQRFRYALIPGAGDWVPGMAAAHAFTSPPRAWVGEGLPFAETVSLGHPAVVLSALKRSEDGRFLVVRGYNATPEPVEAELAVALPHQRVLAGDLAETPGAALGHGRVAYSLRPYEIRTWLIER
ncbi:MAG: glycosyl hydrolase-related protein, partial [Candidatus Sericytochromatia bacterium]